MKKLMLPLLMIITMLFTGCGIPAEVREEANSYAEKYTDAFTKKVTDAYGENAHIKNVQGKIIRTKDAQTNEFVYHTTGDIEAAIIIGQKLYNAVYHPDTKRMETTYSSDTVYEQLLDCLPIDKDQIIYSKLYGKDNSWPAMFDSAIVGIDSAAVTKCSAYLYVITKEDLGKYTYAEIQSIDQLNRIAHGACDCKITIVSVNDEDMIPLLKKDITKYDFSSDSVPAVNGSSKTVFSQYHISESIYVTFQNANIKYNYLNEQPTQNSTLTN